MAIKLADTARPNNYVDAEHLGTFPVAYADDVWFEDGTRLSEKTFDNGGIQVEELPLASVDELGKVYQYIGESGTYTHGCFYECIEFIVLGESTYEWKRLNIIKNPVISAEQPFSVKDYEDETVIVYSGEDLYDFKQGHHYIVKNNIGMDLYLITVTPKEGEEPIVAFVKNNPAQIGEHFYDVSGFCIGIIADITDVSISYYLFSSQTVKTYDNPRFSDMTGHFSATDYFDIGGGGDAVGGIIDVETLPTTDIKNTFYRTKEDVGGKTRTIEVSLSPEMSFDEKVTYLSQYFIVHPDQANNRIDIETYPDLDMTRASWTNHYSVPENTLALMYLDTERIEFHYDSNNSGTPHTETSMVMPLLFSSSHFPSVVYYAGDEANQTTERMATYKDIPKEFTGTQAEWDAMSTAVKKTYGQVNITDDESGTPEYYSTEEVKTGKVWIDGKPIYRKVILNPTFNTTLLTGVDEVVDYRVKRQCYSGVSQGYVYFDGDPSDGVNTGIYINLANNEVKFNDIHSGTYFNARWVILEYTKTTD